MVLKRFVSCALAVLLTACLCIGTVSVGAAATFPDMPKGAENLFQPDSMKLLGTKTVAATYENNTLLLQARSGNDLAWGYLAASFDLPASLKTAANGYALQFHTRVATGADHTHAMTVRIADAGSNDYFGTYYEVNLQPGVATVTYGRAIKHELTLPSTGKCLATPTPTNAIGQWKEVTLFIKPNANGASLSIFIDGEAMTDKSGADTVALEQMDLCLMFGSQTTAGLYRGIRLYAVDPNATAFEPKFDPDAEFGGAENGTEGKDGGDGGVTLMGSEPEPDGDNDSDNGGEDTDNDGDEPPIDNGPDMLPLLLGIGGGVIAIAAVAAVLIVLKKRKTARAATEKEADEDEKV